MNRLVLARHLLTHLGPRWLAFRVRYEWRKKSGALRRCAPEAAWENFSPPPAEAPGLRLFARPTEIGTRCVAQANEILAGRFALFSHQQIDAGFPPDWHRNQLTGECAPADAHWSRVGDFAHGDIKGVWELSRWPWAFSLARAFALKRDERYAEAFWSLAENWLAQNPPNCGANWMCGQEVTFRFLAATFARHALADAKATTTARVEKYRALVYATGRRIAANLDYALSQKNNHGVSECVGLISAAVILPGAPESTHWWRRGLAALEAQLGELVYADGAFAQHSAIYHRVLLHDLLWSVTLLRAANRDVPAWLLDTAQRALEFADRLLTPETGRVPLYGASDGSNVLPLADAEYMDFRPIVQAGFALLHGQRRLPAGPWDEAGQWLAGADAMRKDFEASQPTLWHARVGGIFQLRAGRARMSLRCPELFRHRPSQADLLHVEVEWRGHPIAHDAGTFSYNSTSPLTSALSRAVTHNTLTFDDSEPMDKASRFLYLPWPRGATELNESAKIFSARHYGWRKLGLTHTRRASSPSDEIFLVEDLISGAGAHSARLHWLLADYPHEFDPVAAQLVLRTPVGKFSVSWTAPDNVRASLVRAEASGARGWWAPAYGSSAPALSLVIEVPFTGDLVLTTRFAPA